MLEKAMESCPVKGVMAAGGGTRRMYKFIVLAALTAIAHDCVRRPGARRRVRPADHVVRVQQFLHDDAGPERAADREGDAAPAADEGGAEGLGAAELEHGQGKPLSVCYACNLFGVIFFIIQFIADAICRASRWSAPSSAPPSASSRG